jgi:hypothetical protein
VRLVRRRWYGRAPALRSVTAMAGVAGRGKETARLVARRTFAGEAELPDRPGTRSGLLYGAWEVAGDIRTRSVASRRSISPKAGPHLLTLVQVCWSVPL